MTTVEIIKSLAKKKGWSLQKVAEKAGIGINNIYRWNHVTPSSKSLEKVDQVLNVTPDYLRGYKTSSDHSVDLDDDETIFTYQGKPIPPEDMKIIKRLLNSDDE